MKSIFAILLISLIAFTSEAMCQTETTGKFDKPLSGHIGYATPNKDTLYIEKQMYPLYAEIWDFPLNKPDKPVLIMVDSVKPFYARKEETN